MILRLLLCWALAAPLLRAEPLRFGSTGHRVALIELYTSEGCSSCPPADKWIGALRRDPGLWRDFVPIAFHVTLWDALGWKDRLSSVSFTARQRAYASAWGTDRIYTPCFVRDGAEWHPGWGASLSEAGDAGTLTVSYVGGACSVAFRPSGAAIPSARYAAHAALLGGGISTRVTAGENGGETLAHEFAVLSTADGSLGPGPTGTSVGRLVLPKPAVPGAPRQALAVWVTSEGSLTPLQAAGAWIP
jgi:hypothetical protein